MDRYFVWHSVFETGPRHWNVVDRRDGSYDRETGAKYVASCPDPEMARRIADLLNGQDKAIAQTEGFKAILRSTAKIFATGAE